MLPYRRVGIYVITMAACSAGLIIDIQYMDSVYCVSQYIMVYGHTSCKVLLMESIHKIVIEVVQAHYTHQYTK